MASWLAEHAVTGAANTAIGTAQTGNVKEGAEQAGLAEVGQGVLKGVSKYVAGAAGRAEKSLTEALTPRITGKGYIKAAGAVKPAEPSIFGKAGIDGDATKDVQRAKTAIMNVADTLGKKTKDIIKSGAAQATKNFNRVTDTIGEYAQNVVKPFLQKSGVDYNFADLRKALELVKPSNDLKGEALQTYNETREQILNAVANKVSSQTKGAKNLTTLRSLVSGDGSVPQKVTGGDTDFWDARKIIDDIGNETTKGKLFGSDAHTGASKAWADIRAGYKNYLSDAFRYPGQMENVNKANEFLSNSQTAAMDKTGWNIEDFEKQFGLKASETTAGAQKQWDSFMENLEGLYKGRSSIATKLNTERGKSTLQILAKEYPGVAKAAGAAALGAAGAVGAGGVYEAGKDLLGG